MIHALWLYIFSTCIIHATSCFTSPRRVFPSWASPVISSEEEIISSSTTATSTIIPDGNRKLTAPNFAIQEKILENFQLKNWGSNADLRKQNTSNSNNVNSSDNRRKLEPSSSSGKQLPSPQQRIPFIIENIGRGEKHEIEEIVRVCIDVFFNEQEQNDIELQERAVLDARGNTRMKKRQQKSIPPWKAIQLAYLRNFQTGEILARNAFNKEQYVNLIVARRVYAAPTDGRTNNIRRINIMDVDTNQIFNADLLSSSSSYINGGGTSAAGYELVAGEIIGYCEVSEKNFGLGGNYESTKPRRRSSSSSSASSNTTTTGARKNNKLRPYLSNLSVVDYARKSGVGSKLLHAGEDAVRNWNAGHTEIVLQVEEDNTNAIQFYKRRGWEFVFADPTCRRYDTSGFFLKECRITKYAMIKRLDDDAAGSSSATTSTANKSDEEESESAASFIEKFMSSFFPQ